MKSARAAAPAPASATDGKAAAPRCRARPGRRRRRGAAAGAGGAGGGQTAAARGRRLAAAAPAQPPDPERSGVWRSDDGGKTWRVVSNTNDRPMYYSQIRVDPNNAEIVYLGGAPAFKSVDGGKTFRHDPGPRAQRPPRDLDRPEEREPRDARQRRRPRRQLRPGGDTWDFVNTMAVGQFYAISADMRKPYYVCGGLQDNGRWCGPSASAQHDGILNSDWFRVGGGDGFYTQQDPTDWAIVYAESQDGAVNRLDLRKRARPPASGRARPRARGSGADRAAQTQLAQMRGAVRHAAPSTASNIVPEPPAGETLPLLLEHADRALAAQPEHRLPRRQPAVQVAEPRRHVHDDRRT